MNTVSKPRRTSQPSRCLLACCLGLAIAGPACADAVTDWNSTAGQVAPRFGGPPQQARAMAMIQIAVHDALNSIDPRFESYSVVSTANPNASPDAAVAAAARRVLLTLLAPVPAGPPKTDAINAINAAFDATLGPMPYDAAEGLGIAAGETAADAILQARSNDGSATPNLPYILLAAPGVYQPTPNPEFPAVVTPAFAGWASVTPFAMNSPSQFRSAPGEIFDLTSAAYARDYNEVKAVGDARARGVAHDSVESDVARFWPGGGSNWNRVARIILADPAANPQIDLSLDLWEKARLFALLNMGEADGLLSVFDTKYAYNFWRPVTAIRWTDGDGNAATQPDTEWRSFMATPPYPDYVCGLTTATGAATEVLRRYFGSDDIHYSLTFSAPSVPLPAPLSPLPPKDITRTFDSLSAAADDAVDARVVGGMHFRSGCRQGIRQGSHVGRFVIQHYLKSLK